MIVSWGRIEPAAERLVPAAESSLQRLVVLKSAASSSAQQGDVAQWEGKHVPLLLMRQETLVHALLPTVAMPSWVPWAA